MSSLPAPAELAALRRATSSVPIVFAFVVDPVGAGFITSLAHPGGNVTGFTAFECSISGKWLELLKRIAPHVTRVAVLRDPTVAAGIGQFAAIESTVLSSAIELSSIDTRDASEMVRALDKFARDPNGGVIETASVSGTTHRETIISAVMRLPTVYPFRYDVLAGGLASYRPDPIDQFKRAAKYVDRILKGAKPSELPIQAPTKYELVLNLKAAKALGLGYRLRRCSRPQTKCSNDHPQCRVVAQFGPIGHVCCMVAVGESVEQATPPIPRESRRRAAARKIFHEKHPEFRAAVMARY